MEERMKSFSRQVREELTRDGREMRHCQVAQILGMFTLGGTIVSDEKKQCSLRFCTEQRLVAENYEKLLWKNFRAQTSRSVESGCGKREESCVVVVKDQEKALEILSELGLAEKEGDLDKLLRRSCCKRAYLRGAFLTKGSVSDPNKSYHFEIVCNCKEKAEKIQKIMSDFQMNPKIVLRKKSYVVYLKEGDNIVEILNVMGAHVALLALENIRIVKGMRGQVNRKVNCETANINKTVEAAVRQLSDIEYIQKKRGLEYLPVNLREIAAIRLAHPDASLKELGEGLEPPVGKSGVNHRLRKISELADKLRKGDERRKGICQKKN